MLYLHFTSFFAIPSLLPLFFFCSISFLPPTTDLHSFHPFLSIFSSWAFHFLLPSLTSPSLSFPLSTFLLHSSSLFHPLLPRSILSHASPDKRDEAAVTPLLHSLFKRLPFLPSQYFPAVISSSPHERDVLSRLFGRPIGDESRRGRRGRWERCRVGEEVGDGWGG